jgi:ABC-type lipoprotein release transport system permease subunit
VIVLALAAMTLVALLAGVVPAWRAARIDPAETLRVE